MGATLTVASALGCPHGGTVSIIASSGGRSVLADGSPIVTIADTFTIVGCAFTLPGPKPSPCVRVQWMSADLRNRVGQASTLSTDSVGVCVSAESIPQGPVSVRSTQPKVQTA